MTETLYMRLLGSKDWVASGYADESSWAKATGAVMQSARAFRGHSALAGATWVLPNGEAVQLSVRKGGELQPLESVIEKAVAMLRTDGSPETQMKVANLLRVVMAGPMKT